MRRIPAFALLLAAALPAVAHAAPQPERKPVPTTAPCPPFTDPRGDVAFEPVGSLTEDVDLVRADVGWGATRIAVTLGLAGMPATKLPGDRHYVLSFRVNGRRYVGLESRYPAATGTATVTVVAGARPDMLAPVEPANGTLDATKAEIGMWSDSDLLVLPRGTRLDDFTARATITAPTGAVIAQDEAHWSGVIVVGRGCTSTRKVTVVVRH